MNKTIAVQIILTEPHRANASNALGLTKDQALHWRGPTFDNVLSYKADAGAMIVQAEDGVRYMYPWHTVARVKTRVTN